MGELSSTKAPDQWVVICPGAWQLAIFMWYVPIVLNQPPFSGQMVLHLFAVMYVKQFNGHTPLRAASPRMERLTICATLKNILARRLSSSQRQDLSQAFSP